MAELTRHISDAVDQCDRMPFAFFGHSLGALVAYEVMHLRRARGLPAPVRLVASGCGAPHRRASTSSLHLIDDKQLAAKLKGYGASEEFLGNPELMEVMLPVLRADFRLVSDYAHRAGPVFETPISVFAGNSDSFDSSADYESWGELTRCECKTHWFDGGHFFIESQREKVLDTLRRVLESPHTGPLTQPTRSSG
jgi:medium-chain acyl-[acyl-carrier-protein] hydrolase